ncbi:MAG TPA: hypothetical protein VLC98_11275 [Phnomibacter sp.]|nr:hypothetical protein [Phnomibacter sp.]
MKASFWIRGTYIFQLATGIIHSMSFFVEQVPANEKEKQLLDIMNNYKMDMGSGIHRSMSEIFVSVSACLTLFCLFGGAVILLLYRKQIAWSALRPVMLINTIAFGIGLAVMIRFAFLPPIVCFGLIFICSLMAWITMKKQTQ